MPRSQETRDAQRRVLELLAEAGGGLFRPEDDIVHQGTQIILPERMMIDDAITFLVNKMKMDQEPMAFTRQYKYRPLDGAVCTWHAIKRVFGAVGTKVTYSFFGKNVPQMIDVPIAPGESESVPWGTFTIPGMEGAEVTPGGTHDEEFGSLFVLTIEAPRKYRAQVEGLFAMVEKELREHSIYRGRAFDGQDTPEFLDLSGVDPDKVIYSEEALVQLNANIWSVLRYRHELAEAGISRKRSALLYGPYGTGKTLGGFLTAQVAVESGWTFLYARPGKDNVAQVLQTARLYQPACVFFEDLDTVADPDATSADNATKLLDSFDGITAKGTELIVVLTTNHPDRIHKGMLRPGRLDAIIEIGALDVAGIEKLVKVTLKPEHLAPDVDWELVGKAMTVTADDGVEIGFLPAYAKEAADRTFRYALAREGTPEGIVITTDDLVHAAEGLRPQLLMMEGAKEHQRKDTVGLAIGNTVKDAMVHLHQDEYAEHAFRPEELAGVVERNGKRMK